MNGSLISLIILAVIWLFIVFPVIVLTKLSSLLNMLEQLQQNGHRNQLSASPQETPQSTTIPLDCANVATMHHDMPKSASVLPQKNTNADSDTLGDHTATPPVPAHGVNTINPPVQLESSLEDSTPAQPATTQNSTLGMILSSIWGWLIMDKQFRPAGMTWEYAMATQWLLRIGIGIVLGGVAFFLKYSIEREILGPHVRVSLCILAGITLLVSATQMLNKRYHLQAQGFMGMGFSILYFAFFAASNLYALLTPIQAFACMIGVTITAGVLSSVYYSQMTAWIGLVGGYSTPMLIGSQHSADIGLYAYLTILNCGVLGIAVVRYWPLLNIASMLVSYFFAFIYGVNATQNANDLMMCFVYLSITHVVFLVSLIILNFRKVIPTSPSQHLALIANAMIYWTWIFLLYLKTFSRSDAGLIALILSALYVALIYYCIHRNKVDLIIRNIFIAHACVFLAMASPLFFNIQTCTLAWSIQSAALMWLGGRISQKNIFLPLGNLLFYLCIALVIVHDFPEYYFTRNAYWQTSFTCRLFMLNILPAMLLFSWKVANHTSYASKHLASAIALFFFYCTFESYTTCKGCIPAFATGSITLVWTIFALLLLTMGILRRVGRARSVGLMLFALAVLKLLLVDLHDLASPYRIIAFIVVGILLVCGSFVYLKYRETFETS